MENQQTVESQSNNFVQNVLAAVIFLIVLFAGLMAIRGYFAAQEEKTFKGKVSSLVIAGENLAALADQGITNIEFAKRLDEVKAKYNASGEWPLKFTGANYEYVEAIKGWSLAAAVWDTKVDQASEYAFQNSVDLDGLSAYLGIGTNKIKFFTASDMVRQLLYMAREHAERGKGLLEY